MDQYYIGLFEPNLTEIVITAKTNCSDPSMLVSGAKFIKKNIANILFYWACGLRIQIKCFDVICHIWYVDNWNTQNKSKDFYGTESLKLLGLQIKHMKKGL